MPRISNSSPGPWVLFGAVFTAVIWAALVVLVPLVVNCLPEDFFSDPSYLEPVAPDSRGGLSAFFGRVARNASGWFLILVVGPVGLSLVAVLLGFMLVDVRGKAGVVRWLVTRRCLWRFLEYVRSKGGKPPLTLPCGAWRR